VSWQSGVIVVAAVAAAVNAGAFFAFSNFVMPALSDLSPAEGAGAMQAINRRAPSPMFVGAIVGAGLIALPVLMVEWTERSAGSFRWLAAGVVLSIASFLVTMAFNVPRNDGLDAAGPIELDRVWSDYLVSWVRWNTVRTVTSAASVAAFALSLLQR